MKILMYVFLLLLISGCVASQSFKTCKLEFLGETDKAPPIIVLGKELPKKLSLDKRFYKVSEVFITKFEKYPLSKNPTVEQHSSLLKIEMNGSSNLSRFLSDSTEIANFFTFMKSLADENQYYLLSRDLERIRSACMRALEYGYIN